MKKLKAVGVAIILIILILLTLFANKVDSYPYDDEISYEDFVDNSSLSRWGSTGARYINIMAYDTEHCNNIYCVEKGQKVSDGYKEWIVRSKAVIDGDNVKFYRPSKDSYGNTKWTFIKDGTSGEHNNKLGAILCEGKLGRYTDSLGDTESQNALWSYWNTWIKASGADSIGRVGGLPCSMTKGSSNSGTYDTKYDDYANTKNYKVTVYFLEARPDTNSGYQNLILVERDPPTPKPDPKIDISVSKVWSKDNNDAYGNRTPITVQLYLNNEDTGKSLTLNSSNNWSGTFEELDDESGYAVRESSVPSGYEVVYSGDAASGFTITNTMQYTSITVTKKWDDDDNRDGIRPKKVTATVYANGESFKDVTITGTGNEWSHTITDLPTHIKGKAVTYTVKEKEENVPTGYYQVESQ